MKTNTHAMADHAHSQHSRRMRGRSLAVLAASTALALSSCLEHEATVTIKADGSGTMVEETVLGAEATAMFGQMAQMGGAAAFGGSAPAAPAADPFDAMFGEEAAKKKAAKMGEGVSISKIEKIDRDGRRGARVTYAFQDINKLQLKLDSGTESVAGAGGGGGPIGPSSTEEGAVPGRPESKPVRFRFAGGKLTILSPKPDPAPAEASPAAEVPGDAAARGQAAEMAKAMLGDMKMAIRIVVEPGIRKTNASHVDGNRITLMEMDFGKLLDDPKGMAAFEKLQGAKPENASALLKGIAGVRMETEEEVVVEFD